MKAPLFSQRALLLGLCIVIITASNTWARLNVPRRHGGVVASVDEDTRTLVLAEAKKPKFQFGWIIKPKRFEWTEETEFIRNGQPATPAALSEGAQAEVHYRYETGGKPVLVTVVWRNGDIQQLQRKKP